MNVLILNGSPRAHGTVSSILRSVESQAKECGAQTEFIAMTECSFRSCIGCMKCRGGNICVLPSDDAHLIAQKLQQCDVLVIGSPVYWGNVTGDLKRLFDRLVGVMLDENKFAMPMPLCKGKRAFIVTACTTPFPFNVLCRQTSGAERALSEILGWSGFKVKTLASVPGTKGRKEIPARAVQKARNAIKKCLCQ